ncbi:hypothetical protein SAMN05428959_1011173 [Duganella sp. CF517]|uniref:alpha/beta hydrolase family protein n=1 Tax=Duganella sp. CF517 TaxID=1881038 RepID=UPI0008C169B8|nr:alpha/beta fold hydrolase [Duganella sp. CF517]SEN32237.1 hypothetical protein SAMN05428959_1011173 [Duganella sp. CF517]
MSTRRAGAAPQEQDVSVTVAGVAIPCRFTPSEGDAVGAVLIVPGSLFSDVDGNYPTMNMRPHAYADLARHLSARGFAVLRMAKIGPGTGSQTINPMLAASHVDFLTRVAVAAAGLALLRATVEARPVIVAGHSEGAVVASLLAGGADRRAIDGVVSLSGPALPIFAVMREQIAAMTPPGMAPDLALFDRTVAAIRDGTALPPEAAGDPRTAMLATMPAMGHAYLRSADRVDPVAALAQVRQPVLIVQGGRDASVPQEHAQALRAGRATLPTDVALFPSLNHFYKRTPPGLPPMQSMMLATESDTAVADAIAGWSRRSLAPA